MGAKRVIWHVGFERNLRRRGSTSFEVRSEVPLSEEPPRLDYLLLRKLTPEGEPVDNSAQTLRHLWPLLPWVSVVEYKSPGHPNPPAPSMSRPATRSRLLRRRPRSPQP